MIATKGEVFIEEDDDCRDCRKEDIACCLINDLRQLTIVCKANFKLTIKECSKHPKRDKKDF